MENFTLEDKEDLEDQIAQGGNALFVVYDPNTVEGDPEADAITAGYTEYYREDTANLVEVVYILT